MKATGKQLAEKVMHFRPYHRYYGIFAINPKNENDIWGDMLKTAFQWVGLAIV